MKTIEKLLEPFGFTFGQLQDMVTLLEHLEKNAVPIESFIKYVKEKKIKKTKTTSCDQGKRNTLKCPECNTAMNLFPVNTSPRDQTGDDSKSVWICPKCWHDEYSTKSIKEWLEEIRR